jgi:predicted transcriptional regulator
LESEELLLTGEAAIRVAKALASETSFKLLHFLAAGKQDVSTIAQRLEFSEPYISEVIARLGSLGLINVSYAPGKKGIRKICELAHRKIVIMINP